MKQVGIVTLLWLLLAAGSFAQETTAPPRGGVAGVVVYPDGTPASGATVQAVTECGFEDQIKYSREVTAAENGEFYIPTFGESSCGKVRLSARKGLWLKTGEDVFYGKQIGTSPLVEFARDAPPRRTEIRLGELGGKVEVRVWDKATQRFIWAGLSLYRVPAPPAKFGSMMIATGHDGSAYTLLLPAGTYEVTVDRFVCRDKQYFAAAPVRELVTVEAGKTITRDIAIDVRRIKPAESYANRSGAPCVP